MSETEKGEETELPASTSGKRMSDADFAEARELYELGKMGLIEIADKYGVSRQALSTRFKKLGVVKGSRAGEVAKAAGAAVKEVAERFSGKQAEWIEETRMNGVNALKQAQMIARKIVVDAVKSSTPLDAIDGQLKAAQRYNKIIIDNVDATLRVLRADEHVDEDDLPELIVTDLTNEDILQHHKTTGALPEHMTVEEMLAEDDLDLNLEDP